MSEDTERVWYNEMQNAFNSERIERIEEHP